MNDFKVGDRVEYVGHTALQMNGKPVIVVEPLIKGSGLTYVEYGGKKPWGCYPANLRLVNPAPDAITIPRSELPEVVERDGFLRAEGFEYGLFGGAAEHRKCALAQLAVSEFLAAREEAEQDAADRHAAVLNKRRDELVVEFGGGLGYEDTFDSTKAAIDRIIQLEGEAKK